MQIPGMQQLQAVLEKLPFKKSQVKKPVVRGVMPSAAQESLPSSLPIKFLAVSVIMFAIALLFLLNVSFKMVSVSKAYKAVELSPPKLEDYFPNLSVPEKKESADSKKELTIDEAEVSKSATAKVLEVDKVLAIDKTFEYLSRFENNRSKKILLATKPVIAGLKRGSLAEEAGLQLGDLIVKVNNDRIESVMGYYLATTNKPSSEIEIEFERGGKSMTKKMNSTSSKALNSNNTGIMFLIPSGANYVTKEETVKLAEQYRAEFLSAIPLDWQNNFAYNLMRMAQRVNNEGLALATSNTPETYPIYKFASSDFLLWQHQQYLESIETFFSKRREQEGKVIESLSSLGDALTGLAGGLLFFLCAFLYYFFSIRAERRS